MMRLVLLATLILATALAQSDYYSRGTPPGSYEVLWQRAPAQPPAASPSPTPAAPLPESTPAQTAPQYMSPIPGLPTLAQGAVQNLTLLPVPPGTLFKAQLLTGAMATPLMDTPVLAKAEPDWCQQEACPPLILVGTASFSATARAVLNFTAAIYQGQMYRVNATAFDPNDRLYGLSGTVMDVAPTLAADLLRAAASGLADWVQALNKQGQTTFIPGGGLAVSTEAAPFWAYSLGRIGGIFSLPQNSTTIVRALIRGAGETILVAVLPENQAAQQPQNQTLPTLP